MENYKLASKKKLRFATNKGVLSVEQLWDLSRAELGKCIKEVKKVLSGTDNDDDLSFLLESSKVDVEQQLRFDILKDVYITKKDEAEALKNKSVTKAHNEKILTLIARKQEAELETLSVEELEKQLVEG
jgi:hypothetical protein